MSIEIVADFCPLIDHHVRMKHCVLADRHVFSHYRESPYRCAFPDPRAGRDGCLWMDARLRTRRLVEKRQRPCEIVIRIRRNQASRLRYLERCLYQNRARPRALHLRRILRICQKR